MTINLLMSTKACDEFIKYLFDTMYKSLRCNNELLT